MSDDKSNQPIQKPFDQYQITITSDGDFINILIQNNNNFNIFESKINLDYLHQFSLLKEYLNINEMIEFINNSINKKEINIEENKNNLKLILISKKADYPNVELILNKNIIYETLMKKIESIEEENKELKKRIDLLENEKKNKRNKKDE